MALCIGIFGQSFATGLATAAAVDVMKRELALSGYAGVDYIPIRSNDDSGH